MTKELYIFSGLGADERVFQRLDFSGYSTTFVKWIVPQDKETIEQYATRLLDQITTTKPTLIGLSFGGLIAVEVAKQIETEKVILIASAKTKNEIPFYYRFAGQLKIHRLLPTRILKSSNFITNWLFGASSTFDKQLLKLTIMDGGEILVPITMFAGGFAMVFGIVYLKTRQNLAMIEKGMNPKEFSNRPAPYKNLKWALLLLGAGIGLFFRF